MARCKHLNGELIEYTTVQTAWEVRDGLVTENEGLHDPNDIQNTIAFVCADCGVERRYNRFSQSLPKHIKALVSKSFILTPEVRRIASISSNQN